MMVMMMMMMMWLSENPAIARADSSSAAPTRSRRLGVVRHHLAFRHRATLERVCPSFNRKIRIKMSSEKKAREFHRRKKARLIDHDNDSDSVRSFFQRDDLRSS
jgi:hypothetical protein